MHVHVRILVPFINFYIQYIYIWYNVFGRVISAAHVSAPRKSLVATSSSSIWRTKTIAAPVQRIAMDCNGLERTTPSMTQASGTEPYGPLEPSVLEPSVAAELALWLAACCTLLEISCAEKCGQYPQHLLFGRICTCQILLLKSSKFSVCPLATSNHYMCCRMLRFPVLHLMFLRLSFLKFPGEHGRDMEWTWNDTTNLGTVREPRERETELTQVTQSKLSKRSSPCRGGHEARGISWASRHSETSRDISRHQIVIGP